MRRKLFSFVLCFSLITSGCLEESPPDMDETAFMTLKIWISMAMVGAIPRS